MNNAQKLDELMRGVVDRLMRLVEESDDGWAKPWKDITLGRIRQVESGRPYHGINTLILSLTGLLDGYADPRWGTFKTWQRVEGQVRKGEKSTRIIFWKLLVSCKTCDVQFKDDREAALEHQEKRHGGEYGHIKGVPILQWFNVFNAEQVDDAPPLEGWDDRPSIETQMATAREFVEATGVEIVDHPDRAFYTSARPERISVPPLSQFDTETRYWGTVFHELTHWTGHESRVGRHEGPSIFGSEAYAGEELVAELGAAFLAAHLGVEVEPHPQHAAYLRSWLKAIDEEPARLYHASKQATDAVRFLTDSVEAREEAA